MATPPKTAVPEPRQRWLNEQVEAWLTARLRPGLALQAEAARKAGFNYVVNLYTEWRGKHFYLCARYCNPRPGASESHFEVRTTRLEHTGSGRFNLAYLRHTEKWCTVYRNLSAEESLETMQREELFWPVN
ncbi:MAG: hypothetical protein WDA75_15130 [Candidatus Latescibacterota bacterium]|jgi:hypothetical protein